MAERVEADSSELYSDISREQHIFRRCCRRSKFAQLKSPRQGTLPCNSNNQLRSDKLTVDKPQCDDVFESMFHLKLNNANLDCPRQSRPDSEAPVRQNGTETTRKPVLRAKNCQL